MTRGNGKKAAETMRKRMGEEAYREFVKERGRKGGIKTGMKGFAIDRELARRAGRIGGSVSRKKKDETV